MLCCGRRLTVGQFHQEAEQQLGVWQARGFTPQPGQRVLDLGCGVGRHLAGLRRSCPELRLFGADVSKEMLQMVPPGLATLQQLEQLTLGVFEAASMDWVLALDVFGHLDYADTQGYLREIARVLKPEGRLLATFPVWDEHLLGPSHVPSRLRGYTRDMLELMCEQAGIPGVAGLWREGKQWQIRLDRELTRLPVSQAETLPPSTEVAPLPPPVSYVESVAPDAEDLTVCITNFHRAGHLERAIRSVYAAGFKRVVVASMEPDEAVRQVINRFAGPQLTWTSLPVDLGCNELWLQAAYRSQTDRMILLHDDDFLAPKLGQVYRDTICPALRNGVGFASWRGHVMWDDGSKREIEWFRGDTAVLPSRAIEDFVATKGRLSLSPVISVLRRDVLIGALKEARDYLVDPKCLLHPGMLLGTEILAYLRHCSTYSQWLYVNEVLSYYGAHAGSGTVQAEQSHNLQPLIEGYDVARDHFQEYRMDPPPRPGRLIWVYSDYPDKGEDDRRRNDQARQTWQFHFDQGEVLEFPVRDEQLPRTSQSLGDPRPVPYVRDLFDWGLQFAQPEDVVVYANRDLCVTTTLVEKIWQGVAAGNGAAVAVRRNWPQVPAGRLCRSVRQLKPDGGYDLFAVTPGWWRAHREDMPDMLIGREAWDTVMRTLMEETGGGAAVYVDDCTYHENHMSFWIGERRTNEGQLYNRRLGLEFFRARNNAWLVEALS